MGKEYGGYLPLELPPATGEFYVSDDFWDVVALNSGRATFHIAAIKLRVEVIHLPYFTCAETEQPFRKLGLQVKKYFLTDDLRPRDIDLLPGEGLLWTNYYGNALASSIDAVVEKYGGSLIIDNCHAFFSPPETNAINCYSARKFFGVSDGAYLVGRGLDATEGLARGSSHSSSAHLLQQLDGGTNFGYPSSLENERRLETEISGMSSLTRRILSSVDYDRVRETRAKNLSAMHDILGGLNLFNVNLAASTQMYYPFQIADEGLKNRLVEKKVYNPFWWRHVLDEVPPDTVEARLSREVVLLPIDQRYDAQDIVQIAETVVGCIQ